MDQGDKALPIFTTEIAGQPTIVFAALDYVRALAFVGDDFVRSEFADLRTPDGAPLWDDNAIVMVRPADADESALWERSLIDDLAAGVHESWEDAYESNGFAFLVDYLEPDE